MIKAGTYLATVKDYGITETSKKNPQIVIEFELVVGEGEVKSMFWYGHLTEKTKERTVESLVICGLSNNLSTGAECVAFNKGAGSGVLNEDLEVQVVVEMKPAWDSNKNCEDPTKDKVPSIKWVNAKGSSALKEKMAEADLISIMPGLNLGGIVLDKKKSAPSPKTQNLPPAQTNQEMQAEEIPF